MTEDLPAEARNRLHRLVAQLQQSWELNGDPVETEDFQMMIDLIEGRDVPLQWWDS